MNQIDHELAEHVPDGPEPHENEAKLRAMAYRMLGTVSDAEEAVQDAYVRWFGLSADDRRAISVPMAWKRTTLARICLDRLKSARRKREVYVGEWLPEPVRGEALWGTSQGSLANGELPFDSISMALMIVLDKMTPPERVSFVLHHAFDYTFEEIAEIVDRTPQACRQLAYSARGKLATQGRRRATRQEQIELNEAFRMAWQSGNISTLVALLDNRSQAITDGGGKVAAATMPLMGPQAIADFLVAAFKHQPDLEVASATVNGEPGLIGLAGDRVISVISTSVADGLIRNVWAMRNPDKLSTWQTPNRNGEPVPLSL